jgi:deazaflavin-dependent oxidoreductase (nitroreductase family)
MTQTKYRSHQTTLERVAGNLMGFPKFVLRLPFQTPMSKRLILISYTGRKTGKSYTIPVSYVQQGDDLLIPGGGVWKSNLETGAPVRIRFSGKERNATPEVIRDTDEVEELVTFMMAANPAVSRFIGVPKQSDGRPDRAKLDEAVRGGFALVRLHLDPEWDTQEEDHVHKA